MKNYEILNADYVLSQLLDEPLKGKFKFKVFNVKAELEKKAEIVEDVLKDVNSEEERDEILMEEQDVSISKFTEGELEQIDLSLRQIAMLKPIIESIQEEY